MNDSYEKCADIFLSSVAGQMSGLTKAEFIELCKSKYPVAADFATFMATLTADVEAQIAVTKAQLRPWEVVACTLTIEVPRGPCARS